MEDLLLCARNAAAKLLTERARALSGPDAPAADPDRVRFRPDGKGGVFASPYPMRSGLSPAALAECAVGAPWFSRVYPSGDWIALDPAPAWYDAVRRGDIAPVPLALPEVPPPPEAPWRIAVEDWRFLFRMGAPDAARAGALGQNNPGFAVRYALLRAKRAAGERADEALLREGALCLHLLCSKGDVSALCRGLSALAQRYLRAPGEYDFVARVLDAGLSSLKIYENFTEFLPGPL